MRHYRARSVRTEQLIRQIRYILADNESTIRIEYSASRCAICGIIEHNLQVIAAYKGRVADMGDGVWNLHRCQAAAVNEGFAADRGYGVGNHHRGQAAAVTECIAAD